MQALDTTNKFYETNPLYRTVATRTHFRAANTTAERCLQPMTFPNTHIPNLPSAPEMTAMNDITRNIDPDVAAGFGHEWSTFRQSESEFSPADREAIFQRYFHVFPWDELPPNPVGIDVGCGSGRWSVMVAPKVGHLHL